MKRNIHICAFSGGAASAKMSHLVLDKYNLFHKEIILLFHDTKTEDVDTYRFKDEVSKFLALEVCDDSDGRNIWELFKDYNYLGNGRNTMCSRILKQERSLNHLKGLRDEGLNPILYVGFTPDEWQRAQRVTARYEAQGFQVIFPLIDHNVSKSECHKEIETCWGIRLPKMYEWANHANCLPCIKGKKAYWGLVYKYAPEAWKRAAQAEKEHESTIFTEAGSLEEELDNCIRLAEKYEIKRSQESLFDAPCECIT